MQRLRWQLCRACQTLSKSKGSWEIEYVLIDFLISRKVVWSSLKKNFPNNNTQLIFVPNYNTSTEIGLWVYIQQKLIAILTAWWTLMVFRNFISFFMISQFFVPGVPLRYSKKIFRLRLIFDINKAIDLSVLIKNIVLFFKIRRVIRKILST